MIQLLSTDDGPAALDSNFEAVVGMVPEFASEDTMLNSDGTTSNGHRIRVEYRCCQYREDLSMGQTVAGIAGDDGQLLASMIFMNVSSDHEEIADADFEALVRSIRFSGDADTGLTPANGDGGLDGMFTHLDFGLMPNVFGGDRFQLGNRNHRLRQGRHCSATPFLPAGRALPITAPPPPAIAVPTGSMAAVGSRARRKSKCARWSTITG